ncbi:uncharacterized protein LOC111341797 [Stylophora pistillata]|uniref:uncharacterized protein LOC111341797 n=1 Tax=Stylophora pistillata TaxID=50429 RepID=UPI000C03CF27|nr:uncharacterized protein LOC111341797 [Stylophora pistillata]
MAESSDVSAVKVFNYISGSGGVLDLLSLLKHPSPLAKKSTVNEVILWFKTQKDIDPNNRLVLVNNQRGEAVGVRIDLAKQLCLKYTTEGSCKSRSRCRFWHLCKEFLEGTCKGNCGRSHDFHDEDNKAKIVELGFAGKATGPLKTIVAGSFLQVCLMYSKNGCVSLNCPYLHICLNAARLTACDCFLSHNFADPHNRSLLQQYGYKPPRTSEMDVVRCNILVPKQQKSFEGRAIGDPSFINQPTPRGSEPGNITQKFPPRPSRPGAVSLAGLCQNFPKTESKAPTQSKPAMHHIAVPSNEDPLFVKVFNFICAKGGYSSLADLLQHPSPLARKFSTSEVDATIWLQVNTHSEQGQKIILLENQNGNILGARVNSRKKMCLQYMKGSCKSLNTCQYWHICKGYLEGTCQGGCGLSHDFHDEGNIKKIQRLDIEQYPNGTLRKIISHSFPRICLAYLNTECISSHDCPHLHICPLAFGGNPCSCNLSHAIDDNHNATILKQFDLDPPRTKLYLMQCNILMPKRQKGPAEGKLASRPAPLMSLPLAQKDDNLDSQAKGLLDKKGKQRRRQRTKARKKTNQASKPSEESLADDIEEGGSDSTSDNEDLPDKPDLYSGSKFSAQPRPSTRHADGSENPSFHCQKKQMQSDNGLTYQDQVSEMGISETPEKNLINFDELEDELQDLEDPFGSLDDFSTFEPLSQVDDLLFNLSPTNTAGALSQESTFFDPSDQDSSASNQEKQAVDSVFQYICKEHNGEAPYDVISQCYHILPPDVLDISAWFRENSNRFMIIENCVGGIELVRAHTSTARICFRYLMNKAGCKNPKCFRYHVCKHYLANGVCPLGKKCRYSQSHNLKSSHNKKITKQQKLTCFSEEQLRVMISASVPDVCLAYNKKSARCKKGLRCQAVHVCKYFVMGSCKKGTSCPLSHEASLKEPHSQLVLEKYNLTKVPAQAVLRALLVRGQLLPSTMETAEEHETAGQPKKERVMSPKREMQNVHSPQYICLEFLLGHCGKAQLCDYCHHNMPYLWQYRYPGNEQADSWKTFTENECEEIERQFCIVDVTETDVEHIVVAPPPTALIDPGEGYIKVNFDEMKAETGVGSVELRRLSTKSVVLSADHALLTKWVWYLSDQDSCWTEYDSELMTRIEDSFTKGRSFHKFKSGGEDHKLFFHKTSMYQQSTKPPIKETKVRRRPLFRSKSEIERLKSPLELPIPLQPVTPVQSTSTSSHGHTPSHWEHVPEDLDFMRVPLTSKSDEFKLAESLFRQTMSENKASIISIERVQNPFLWKKYADKKEWMKKKALVKDNPKLLFHGVDPQVVDTMCEENIDCRALGEDRAAQFGQGAYFTEEAALSNLYCRQDSESFRYMFLCEVIVGSFAKGEPSLTRPPLRSDSEAKKQRYDSCVDNVTKPTIFVLFASDQYYPTFLVKFKTKSKLVC